MLKKSFIILSVFCLIVFLSSTAFAANNMTKGTENVLNNIKDGAQNMARDAEGAMGHAKDRNF